MINTLYGVTFIVSLLRFFLRLSRLQMERKKQHDRDPVLYKLHHSRPLTETITSYKKRISNAKRETKFIKSQSNNKQLLNALFNFDPVLFNSLNYGLIARHINHTETVIRRVVFNTVLTIHFHKSANLWHSS